jgi:transketolase
MIIDMIHTAGSGHPGPSLSCVEILVALYFDVMRDGDGLRPRDRFVLSKGHACPALYAVLIEKGVLDPGEVGSLRAFGSRLQGHPDARTTPGVEISTGSLGTGVAVAAGVAAGLRLGGGEERVFALVGDGECQEGLVWECAMSAVKHRLDNLTVVVDCNGFQTDGAVADVMPIDPLPDKWASFGWDVETVDGHDLDALIGALGAPSGSRPRAVLAHTVKGRGVSFMEHSPHWHSAPLGQLDFEAARTELAGSPR